MSIDLNELKRLAEAATPGEWQVKDTAHIPYVISDHGQIVDTHYTNTNNATNDCAYIAAANPAVLLELVDRLERTEAALRSIEDNAPQEEPRPDNPERNYAQAWAFWHAGQVAREALATIDTPR